MATPTPQHMQEISAFNNRTEGRTLDAIGSKRAVRAKVFADQMHHLYGYEVVWVNGLPRLELPS